MSVRQPIRIMWLLNHTAARDFELPMLRSIGFTEVFTPKSFPQEHNFRSASVDDSYDQGLSIPKQDLALLNSVDWYRPVHRDIWDVANKYFQVIFFMGHNFEFIKSMAARFNGCMIWRAYGLDSSLTYTDLLRGNDGALRALGKASSRLMFGEAYKELSDVEDDLLRIRAVYLPVGMPNICSDDCWVGDDVRLLFVCPDIGVNAYYRQIYRDFLKNYGSLPHVIGGAQPVTQDPPNVLGFVPKEQHDRNMRHMRVMFYHSSEPRHLHYHPLEAIRLGMPLVFMGGGLLDKLGGRNLPGRATTHHEAYTKLKRVLDGDGTFTEDVRRSQTALLQAMDPDRLRDAWREGMRRVVAKLRPLADVLPAARRTRIGVILPIEYRGGSLRGAKLLAEALHKGSRQAGEPADILIGHLDRPDVYTPDQWRDLPGEIALRPFEWTYITPVEATDAMRMAGYAGWVASAEGYGVANDGMRTFQDCDLWVVISDRLAKPMLPLKPSIMVVYDYIQRYIPLEETSGNRGARFLDAARHMDQIFVTTNFTRVDAIQYAGISSEKISKLPMLAPYLKRVEIGEGEDAVADYFLWTTNTAPHKNHKRAIQALSIYYGELDGRLRCKVTGVNTQHLFDGKFASLDNTREEFRRDPLLQKKIEVLGELPERRYRTVLERSKFLWHPGLIDNGTFSVIEAASMGVPSLSSDYPPMREIDQQFLINLSFFDPHDPEKMASALKAMEIESDGKRKSMNAINNIHEQTVSNLALSYWESVRNFL